ncbi:bifunctional lytic transglycosylase/C40 family peptidase [Ammoniphilus sp. 3BR4]
MEHVFKKNAHTTAKVAILKSPVTWILLMLALFVSSMIGMTLFIAISLGGDDSWDSPREGAAGTVHVSKEVLRYEPLIRKYAAENDIEPYVGLILALIQQESGGRSLDVMQASESIGLPPQTIMDPEYSISIGVQYFAQVLKQAKGDIPLALQAYNFGNGFIDYAMPRGGYSKQVAKEFSEMMATKMGWDGYGDVNYVDHVLRYYSQEKGLEVVGDGTQSFDVEKVHDIMKKYLGLPYVWGGRTPSDGGFDCSGLLEYAFAQIGVNLYGTAKSQYDKTIPIRDEEAKPGDLVFFSTYKPGPSHVGMYVGNGTFINANGSGGVSYSSVQQWKDLYPYLGFRRIE